MDAIIELHTDLTVVAINDMPDVHANAHLFRYDSTYGFFPGKMAKIFSWYDNEWR